MTGLGLSDILLLLLLAGAVTAAVLHLLRVRRRGNGCCGDCASCGQSRTGKKEKSCAPPAGK